MLQVTFDSIFSWFKQNHSIDFSRLKLFLENFGIRSCVLNSELPINSRMHIIEQFNGGLYDTIIASDEKLIDNDEEKNQKNDDENDSAKKQKKPKRYFNNRNKN